MQLSSSSSSPLISLSPSFNNYSSNKLAEIAARVIKEVESEPELFHEINFKYEEETENIESIEEKPPQIQEEMKQNCEEVHEDVVQEEEEEDEDDEFEFAVVSRDSVSSPISADEIFYNGQIKPTYPLFNTDLLLPDHEIIANNSESQKSPLPSSTKSSIRIPLGKLLIEERDNTPSCSSSDADELDGLSPESYCVWTPKPDKSPKWREKSKSTGSSKRWKFRDMLRRSNSEGKNSFVFFSNSNANSKKKEEETIDHVAGNVKAKVLTGGESVTAVKEVEKRRSYLPYRQDLVGIFGNVNGIGRNLNLNPYPF